jgi:uncharacterized protein (DUF1778 family)
MAGQWKRCVGEDRRDEPLNMRITPALGVRMDAACKALGLNRSEFVRRVVVQGLAALERAGVIGGEDETASGA